MASKQAFVFLLLAQLITIVLTFNRVVKVDLYFCGEMKKEARKSQHSLLCLGG